MFDGVSPNTKTVYRAWDRIEIVLEADEDGFNASIPQLDLITFGRDREQALRRIVRAMLEYYELLTNGTFQPDERRREHLDIYRRTILPALGSTAVGVALRPPTTSLWDRLRTLVTREPSWLSALAANLVTSFEPSAT